MYFFSKTLKIFKIKYNSMIVKMAKMKTDEQKVSKVMNQFTTKKENEQKYGDTGGKLKDAYDRT